MNITLLVKLYILEICGGPTSVPEKLPDYVPLAHLGYDEDISLCRSLELKLQQLAIQYHTGKHINIGLISEHTTVSQCISLVA